MVTLITEPNHMLFYTVTSLLFDNHTDCVGDAVWRMWYIGRQHKYFPFFYDYNFSFTFIIDNFYKAVTFKLIEKLFSRTYMEITSSVWAPNHHHNHVRTWKHFLVIHWWL